MSGGGTPHLCRVNNIDNGLLIKKIGVGLSNIFYDRFVLLSLLFFVVIAAELLLCRRRGVNPYRDAFSASLTLDGRRTWSRVPVRILQPTCQVIVIYWRSPLNHLNIFWIKCSIYYKSSFRIFTTVFQVYLEYFLIFYHPDYPGSLKLV